MEVTFYGGADEVGRSSVGVRLNRQEVLLDYGVKIGHHEEVPEVNHVPSQIIITHTHLDHAAYLPHLFKKKRRTQVHMTKPTRDLIQLMIADYMRVSGHRFDNSAVLNNLLGNCVTHEIGELARAGRVRFSLHHSGHILGGASILLHSKKGNLLYTGDINTRKSRIIEPAEKGLEAKTLIIESTYGGFNDVIPPVKESYKQLREIIERTIKRGGRVLIPSFAVGRAQELILTLDSMMRNGTLEPLPIYIDGMIKKALRIYRHNVICARKELQRSILVNNVDPFSSNFVYIPKRRDRMDAIEEGSIIITTSGMLKGGPVMTYLKALADDPRNTLVFVGYQAPGTPGREILDGARTLIIDNEEVEINLEIQQVKLSAHADQRGLLEYARSVKELETVFIVHGESSKRRELKRAMDDLLDGVEVILPKLGESFEIL